MTSTRPRLSSLPLYWWTRDRTGKAILMKTYARGCVWRRDASRGGWDLEWRYHWHEVEPRYDSSASIRAKNIVLFKKEAA